MPKIKVYNTFSIIQTLQVLVIRQWICNTGSVLCKLNIYLAKYSSKNYIYLQSYVSKNVFILKHFFKSRRSLHHTSASQMVLNSHFASPKYCYYEKDTSTFTHE